MRIKAETPDPSSVTISTNPAARGAHSNFIWGGCQHALDRLNFSGPTERIWAVRYHWEL